MTSTDFSSHKVGLKLKDMCAYMGISDDERHLFWVAELALLAKLPPYWKQVFATCVPPVSACSSSASTYLRTKGWHLAVPLYCVTKRLKFSMSAAVQGRGGSRILPQSCHQCYQLDPPARCILFRAVVARGLRACLMCMCLLWASHRCTP